MNLAETISRYPFLASPAALMQTYRGEAWKRPPHIEILNAALVESFFAGGGQRFLCNVPYQHGKSDIASRGFPSWALLWNPDLRISIVGHGEKFAQSEYGAEVKKIIETFGPELGIFLRRDAKAKGRWKIEGHQGGMGCFGPDTGGVGYPSDIFCIDDLIKNREQAMSPGEMDKIWRFYETTVFSRIRNETSVYITGTRWSRRDLFGRLIDMSKRTGEKWRHIKFAALCREKDVDPKTGKDNLGRKIGDALWPEMVSLHQLEMARQEFGSYFNAAYQQEPADEASAVFWPLGWERYEDGGDAFALPNGIGRCVVMHGDCTVIITVDWGASKKKTADPTAILVGALVPDGRLLILDAVNERVGLSESVGLLAKVCQRWRPHVVGVEATSFQAAMADQCRRYPEIPEVRRLQVGNQQGMKLVRAFPARIMGENRRILLPNFAARGIGKESWPEVCSSQWEAFTGIDDEHDDLVDCLSYMAKLAQEMRPTSRASLEDHGPCLLVPGKQDLFF